MQGERVVYQNFTLSPPPQNCFSHTGGRSFITPRGEGFFLQNVVYQNFNPPPTPQKKKIIVTYENCTLPPRQKQF